MTSLNKFIPSDPVSAIGYAKWCDFSFMRTDNHPHIPNDQFSDITSGSSVYCWSSHLNNLFSFLHSSTLENITLVTGDNDHPTNPNGVVIGWPELRYEGILPMPKSISHWFAQNAEVKNEAMTPIPIGLGKNQTCDPVFLRTAIQDIPRDKLVYCNSSIVTNPIQRSSVVHLIKRYCPEATHQESRIEPNLFYEHLQQHKFVVCPPGNGKDTHRVWESLCFGAIPIVEDSTMNRYFATMFPILIVSRWTDIRERYLMDKYEEIVSKSWDSNLLSVNYLMTKLQG